MPFYTDVSSNKGIPTLETEEMIREGLEFQDKLLFIRLRYWNEIEIEKTTWIEGVTDHRLNSALLPIYAFRKFAPAVKDLISEVVGQVEKERKRLKAQSDDGVLINALWEKIDEGL